MLPPARCGSEFRRRLAQMTMTQLAALDASALPSGIRARFVSGINGLTMHMLEAGFEGRKRPCVLLLHGFP